MKITLAFLYALSSLAVVGAFDKRVSRAFSIPRGGGWLSDTVEESASSAKARAKEAYGSAASKTTDAVTNAKATAEKAWLKRVDDLEARLRDEKAKAQERLEKAQKRISAQADKEQKKLLAKIDALERKLEAQKK